MSKVNKKITSSHTTLTDLAREVVETTHHMPEVSKISIGIIKTTTSKGGKRGIKFLPITGGLKAIVRGSGSVQELYIYTKNPKVTEQTLINIV